MYMRFALIRSLEFLLTQSPMIGLHICLPGFLQLLELPPSVYLKDHRYNVMEMLRAHWAGSGPELAGTAKWEAKNVEWLLLNIICELDGTPYCKRSPDIQKAYVPIVRSLVSKLPLILPSTLSKYREDAVAYRSRETNP